MPQTRFKDAASTLRTLSRLRMRDASNVLQTIQRIRGRDASNALRVLWQYMSVALDTYYVSDGDGGFSHGGHVFSTVVVTGTVTGGTAPYTYDWQYVSGTLAMNVDSPTANATTFDSFASDGNPAITVWRLQVTDANGAVVVSSDLTVQLDWADFR